MAAEKENKIKGIQEDNMENKTEMEKIDVKETDKDETGKNIIQGMFHIKLSKPYSFENKEHTDIDLSGYEKMSANDLVQIERLFYSSGGMQSFNIENTYLFATIAAAHASNMPVEFFQSLNAKDAARVRRVTALFFIN